MQEARAEGPVLFVSAGNCLFKREYIPKPQRRVEAEEIARLMVRAYGVMGLDAMSVGAYDLSLGIDFLLGLAREASFPFLSANLVGPHGRRYFAAYRMLSVGGNRVALVGLLDDDLKKSRIPLSEKIRVLPPLETAERVLPRVVREEKPDLVVVLTDMMDRDLRRLALSGLPVHVIIGSSRRNQLQVPARMDSTLVCSLDRGGKTLGRIDVQKGEGEGLLLRNRFVPLSQHTFPDHPRVASLVAETLARIKEIQASTVPDAGKASEEGCGQEFVGAEACRSCHPERYEHWRSTPHASAYGVLKREGREFDTDCLPCHTVAYECSDGEVDRISIERFADVQCESCHGPGSVHVAAAGDAPLGAGLACPKCHTPERSDEEDVSRKAREVCAE